MSDFVTVAKTSEIPVGERIVVEINRHWVAVFNVDGQFYAIEDLCTHDGGELADGELSDYDIACVRHGAKFDVRTGKVTKAPALVDVPVYHVRVENDEIQVSARKRQGKA